MNKSFTFYIYENDPFLIRSNASVKSGNGKSGWGSDFGTSTDLWGSVSKARNPPPGIANQGKNSHFLSYLLKK